MKKNRTGKIMLLLVMITLVTSGMLFAGGGQEAETETPQKEEPAVENITLTFAGYFTKENAEANAIAFHESKEKYLKEHPNVTIDEEILAHDSYETKMMAMAASGEVPDFFQLKATWIENFIDNDLIEPLDDLIKSDSAWKNNFYPGAFADFTFNNKIYGIPYQIVTVSNLLYNKGIFEECGIDAFPSNKEDFENAIKTLRAKGFIPITAGNKGGWFLDVVVFRGILDRYADTEWKQSMINGRGAKLTDPEFVNALKELKKWGDLNAFNEDLNSIDYMQMRNHYFNRKAAMMMDGAGGMKPISDSAPEEILNETVVTVLPPLAGGTPNGNPSTAGWSLGYYKHIDAAKKEVVWDLLKYLSNRAHAKIIVENNGFPAMNPGEYDQSKLSDLTNKYNAMLNNAVMTPLINFPPAVLQVLYSGLQEMMIGQISPEELAEKLQTELESL